MKANLLFINMTDFPRPARAKSRLYRTFAGFLTALMLLFQQQSVSQTYSTASRFGPVQLQSYKVSGSFGELRSNHFHSGIDLKTNEQTGLPVLAAAAGYVSRVKVSNIGYGKALYITHPDGIVTVYAHLEDFAMPQILDTVAALQFQKQQYETELFFTTPLFQVNGGQIIGWSGNSGGSEGPHLHFETRHEVSEMPFDPALIGYSYQDTIHPAFRNLVIYTPGPGNGTFLAQRNLIPVDTSKSNPAIPETIEVPSNYFIGFEAFDRAGLEPNLLGIKEYRLFTNEILSFEYKIDSFLFDQSRLINSIIDYPFWSDSSRRILLCHTLPGNMLPFIKAKPNQNTHPAKGITKHRIEIKDASGNISELHFEVAVRANAKPLMYDKNMRILKSNQGDRIIGSKTELIISEKTLTEEVGIQLVEHVIDSPGFISPVIEIASPGTFAVIQPMKLTIKPVKKPNIPTEKWTIARLDSSGSFNYIGGKVNADLSLTGSIRTKGKFVIIADTVAPILMDAISERVVRFGGMEKVRIVVETKGDFSGISTYSCVLDGKWIPASSNPGGTKFEIITPVPDVQVNHELNVVVTDMCGNKATKTYQLVY